MRYPSRFAVILPMTIIMAIGALSIARLVEYPAYAQQDNILPAPGTVRVIAYKLHNDHTQVEWQWAILTERNWRSTETNSQGEFKLSGSYPMTHPTKANVYDLYGRVQSSKDNSDQPHLHTTTTVQHFVHKPGLASDRMSSSGGGDEPLRKVIAADKAARVLLTSDRILTLPVKVPLYERTYGLDGTGKIRRQIYYLILTDK